MLKVHTVNKWLEVLRAAKREDDDPFTQESLIGAIDALADLADTLPPPEMEDGMVGSSK